MKKSDFAFDLPTALIAQAPLAERSASRLLVVPPGDGAFEDRGIADLPGLYSLLSGVAHARPWGLEDKASVAGREIATPDYWRQHVVDCHDQTPEQVVAAILDLLSRADYPS